MKSITRKAALLASLIALAACGGQETATDTSNAAAPEAPAAANDSTSSQSAAGTQTGGSAAARQDFTLVNNTGRTVMTLNVSPSDSNEWGPDILGANVIENGQSGQVGFERGQEQCNWDFRATYDDGNTTDARGVNLCEVATVTLTGE